jgi:hypothetical protein
VDTLTNISLPGAEPQVDAPLKMAARSLSALAVDRDRLADQLARLTDRLAQIAERSVPARDKSDV